MSLSFLSGPKFYPRSLWGHGHVCLGGPELPLVANDKEFIIQIGNFLFDGNRLNLRVAASPPAREPK